MRRFITWWRKKYVWHNEYYHDQYVKYYKLAHLVTLFGAMGSFMLYFIDEFIIKNTNLEKWADMGMFWWGMIIGVILGMCCAYKEIDQHEKIMENK